MKFRTCTQKERLRISARDHTARPAERVLEGGPGKASGIGGRAVAFLTYIIVSCSFRPGFYLPKQVETPQLPGTALGAPIVVARAGRRAKVTPRLFLANRKRPPALGLMVLAECSGILVVTVAGPAWHCPAGPG